LFVTKEAKYCQLLYNEYGIGMETIFVGMGGDGSETGWGQVGTRINSAGMGVVFVFVQMSRNKMSHNG